MLRFQLPTDRIEYLQLAFPVAGYQLVARWGTQTGPFTVAAWDDFANPLVWKLTDGPALQLSPDGEWVSVHDMTLGTVTITRVGASTPHAVLQRARSDNVWTAAAPGGDAIAWKEGDFTVVRTVPGGEPVARVKTGWAVEFRHRFVLGTRNRGIESSGADRVFDLITRRGPSTVCRANHLTAAVLGYQIAWLKAHFPAEFQTAVGS